MADLTNGVVNIIEGLLAQCVLKSLLKTVFIVNKIQKGAVVKPTPILDNAAFINEDGNSITVVENSRIFPPIFEIGTNARLPLVNTKQISESQLIEQLTRQLKNTIIECEDSLLFLILDAIQNTHVCGFNYKTMFDSNHYYR